MEKSMEQYNCSGVGTYQKKKRGPLTGGVCGKVGGKHQWGGPWLDAGKQEAGQGRADLRASGNPLGKGEKEGNRGGPRYWGRLDLPNWSQSPHRKQLWGNEV